MGVPVVTQPGETFAGRHALSYSSTVGLTETIATDSQDYVQRAVDLASDLDRLARLRAELRTRIAKSPLCDAQRFAAGFEEALRTMWHQRAGGQ